MSVAKGQCLCGTVRFEISGDIAAAGYCHCSDCRKCTGSAFGISVPVSKTNLRLICGNPKAFTKTGDSGNELTRHFCPDCGSPLFTSSPGHPERIYVKAGAFDDANLIKPGHQSWTSSAVRWASISSDLPSYPKSRA